VAPAPGGRPRRDVVRDDGAGAQRGRHRRAAHVHVPRVGRVGVAVAARRQEEERQQGEGGGVRGVPAGAGGRRRRARAAPVPPLLPRPMHRRLAVRALVVPGVPRAPGARARAADGGARVPAAAAAAPLRRVAGAAHGVEGPGGYLGAVAVEEQLLDERVQGDDRVQVTIAEASLWFQVSVSNPAGVRRGVR
jgi:hypothetical protein